ncbi:GAF and ANTAR domain-containing protein [Jatrophihabitans sp. YIM 134969]
MTTSDMGPDTAEREYTVPADAAEFAQLASHLELQEALVALGTLLLSTPSLEAYLVRVADLAVQVFDPPATCGVSLYVDDTPVTVAASGLVAGQVEETQYAAGEGPCLHTMRTGETVDVPDLAADSRWPAYRTHAMALGLGSCHTVPLSDGVRTVGALNVHAATVHAFDDDTRRALRLFAAQTSAALELLRREAQQRKLGEQLQEALASRAVIDQAMGIVMATRRCTAEDAFAFLRRTSQNANRKLRDVATDLVGAVAEGRGPGPTSEVSRSGARR